MRAYWPATRNKVKLDPIRTIVTETTTRRNPADGRPWHHLAVRITLATGETLAATTDVRGITELATLAR